MRYTWFILQFIWTVVKLSMLILVVGAVTLFPVVAALSSLVVVYLGATGYISVKTAAILLSVIFVLQGIWAIKWG